MFDIYFSLAHGFEIDFPFLSFWLHTEALAVILISVIALRIRKIVTDRKRVSVSKVSENVFVDDLNEFDLDWSK